MGKTATETLRMMKLAYGHNALSLVHGFLNGGQDFGTTLKISKMMNTMNDQQPFEHLTVQELISTDHRMTLWMMEVERKINRETILKILVEDLRIRMICTRFVPHCLTNE
jgi:hypothetical protein